MPPRPVPTGKSSSRSSKISDGEAPTVAVGEIVAAHGLEGLVRVRAYQPPAPSLEVGREVLLERSEGARARVHLAAVSRGGRRLLVRIEGVSDRDAAEALVGARVLVRADDLPSISDDEFYYHEVEGFVVETVAGQVLGTVSSTFSTGLHDVWIVRDGGHERLVPVITEVVRALDRAARRIVVDPLPGLFD